MRAAEGTPGWPVTVVERLSVPVRDPRPLATLDLAALCGALHLCVAHQPKGGGGGAPPSEARTVRGAAPGTELNVLYERSARDALAWLERQQRNGRFAFFGEADAGVTSMALAAVLRTCRRLGEEPPAWVDEGLDWLASLQDENGAIHQGRLMVYVTSCSLLAFQDAGRPQDRPVIERGQAYLMAVQSDESEGYASSEDWAYGGIGYGGDLRPDLSNTQLATEALAVTSAPGREISFRKAMTFLQRCQNLEEVNDLEHAQLDGTTVIPGNDGGATYYPGNSKAGTIELGDGKVVARSYGSMTYALLKTYLFCGLPLDDPRVQAAIGWIEDNYTLEYNPGFDRVAAPGSEYQGLYYYYFTMAKALDLSGLEVVRGADGQRHAWREELARHLLQIGFREGYWINDRSGRWWEELPVLATSYTLIALDHCIE